MSKKLTYFSSFLEADSLQMIKWGRHLSLQFSLACCFYVGLLDNLTSLPGCNHLALLFLTLSASTCYYLFLTALQISSSHKLQSLHLIVTSLIHLCQWHNLNHPFYHHKGCLSVQREQIFCWAYFLPSYQARIKMRKWWFSVPPFLSSAVFQHPSCLLHCIAIFLNHLFC